MLMRDYYTNQVTLEKLDAVLKDPGFNSKVDSITIFGSASLVGNLEINSNLSHQRALALKTYIRWKHPGVYDDRIYVLPYVFNWDVLTELVQNDPLVPGREETLKILGSSTISDQSKVNQIKQLGNGKTEAYLTEHFARYMRTATSVFFNLKEEAAELPEVVEEPVVADTIEEAEVVVAELEDIPEILFPAVVQPHKAYRPLFAVKTNLLYDLLSVINVELEVPIGKHFSIAGEWIFPWWLWEKKQYALEVLNGNLELRYWWGNHTKDNLLTGWYLGVYGGAGLYDVEWKTEGYQGEFFSTGLSGGFAHKISKHWRLEYSLGVGYMGTKHRNYIPEMWDNDNEWHLIKQKSGNSFWIGPTRAKISLVWMISR